MSNQLQMNTKSQFKETFDEMLLNNKRDEYIFKYRGHTYALVNLEDNKIMVTNLWNNDSIWDDFFWDKERDNAGDITSELAWMKFNAECYGSKSEAA
jgi:hypothetical protein